MSMIDMLPCKLVYVGELSDKRLQLGTDVRLVEWADRLDDGQVIMGLQLFQPVLMDLYHGSYHLYLTSEKGLYRLHCVEFPAKKEIHHASLHQIIKVVTHRYDGYVPPFALLKENASAVA